MPWKHRSYLCSLFPASHSTFVFGVLLFLSAVFAAPNGSGASQLFLLTLQKSDQENVWILSWPTQPGGQYTLQKTADLATWADVITLTAQSNLLTQADTGLTNENKTFWRVALLSG